ALSAPLERDTLTFESCVRQSETRHMFPRLTTALPPPSETDLKTDHRLLLALMNCAWSGIWEQHLTEKNVPYYKDAFRVCAQASSLICSLSRVGSGEQKSRLD
ncbi:hypothetical protein KUCAC02_035297, partial [Chaenocephalus aceratus]